MKLQFTLHNEQPGKLFNVKAETVRFFINGVTATIVHYVTLNICIHIFILGSVGLSNFIAAMFGITVSFLGNRYFVFQSLKASIFRQYARFISVYGFLTVFQGLAMYFLTDLLGFNYHFIFFTLIGIQFFLSFLGNKLFIFKL